MRDSTRSTSSSTTIKFSPRLTEPTIGSPGALFYVRKSDGGYNNNTYQSPSATSSKYKGAKGCSALYNCVAYVQGRINEIAGSWKYNNSWNGGGWWYHAESTMGFKRGSTPQVGAVMCYHNDKKGGEAGHVMVVEKVNSDGSIVISESAYSSDLNKVSFTWRTRTVSPPSYGAWTNYSFQGFLYHPDIPRTATAQLVDAVQSYDYGSTGSTSTSTALDILNTSTALDILNTKTLAEYNTVVVQNYTKYRGQDLLSSASLVEAPFIILQIGNYTFGSYTREGTLEKLNSTMKVTYPNYMKSINIVKTNGVLNQYTIQMVYQVVPGQDPNLLDRIFSTIADTRQVTLSYGDWESPSFIYSNESALLTKVTSHVDFANQQITYTLECTSTALKASAQQFDFPGYSSKKGSDIIKSILKNNQYGLLEIFPGMKDEQAIANHGLIPGDDKEITIEAQKSMDPLSYINYIVGCMTSNTTATDADLKDATYHLVIMDDTENELGGAYFKVIKVGTSTKTLAASNIYEVDIGVPSSTLVTNFDITTDNSWSILYNYAQNVDLNKYVYTISDTGQIKSDYVNSAMVSAYYNRTTEIDKTWWTRMTQFPITATLTIKGLLRPAILMTYLRVNTYFYGQKHISSGLYIITKQEDEISESGYRTTLTLTRIAEDDDGPSGITQSTTTTSSATTTTTV